MAITSKRLVRIGLAVPVSGVLLLAGCAEEGIGEDEFGELDTRVGDAEARLGDIETRFGEMEERVGVLEEDMELGE